MPRNIHNISIYIIHEIFGGVSRGSLKVFNQIGDWVCLSSGLWDTAGQVLEEMCLISMRPNQMCALVAVATNR